LAIISNIYVRWQFSFGYFDSNKRIIAVNCIINCGRKTINTVMNYFTKIATWISKCTFIAYHCVPPLHSPAPLGNLRWGNASDHKLEVGELRSPASYYTLTTGYGHRSTSLTPIISAMLMLYGRRFLQVKRPNKQYWRKIYKRQIKRRKQQNTHMHRQQKDIHKISTISLLVYNNMGWLGDSSHRGQGRQAWTAVGLPRGTPECCKFTHFEKNFKNK